MLKFKQYLKIQDIIDKVKSGKDASTDDPTILKLVMKQLEKDGVSFDVIEESVVT